jgi:hypothetical protein
MVEKCNFIMQQLCALCVFGISYTVCAYTGRKTFALDEIWYFFYKPP